ncbi:MAG TPA: hypothetical protein DDW27_22060 [Bacteroidales bacterium]|nr:hypothetical protein [Bacteroidales bacterium]
MKIYLSFIFLLVSAGIMVHGQSSDPFVTNCIMNAGSDARYLKDFRVQLGKTVTPGEPRYKAQMSLWKNTKYRFSMCNSEDSEGHLFLNLKDDANKTVLSSFDPKSGKTYPYIDFICNKSGIYQLSFDFTGGQKGSGVGVVSMIK